MSAERAPLLAFDHVLSRLVSHSRSMLRSASRLVQRSTARPAVSQRAFATDASEYQHGPSFNLSEDQTAMQQLARDFAANEIIPQAAEYDRSMKVSSSNSARRGAPATSLSRPSLEQERRTDTAR